MPPPLVDSSSLAPWLLHLAPRLPDASLSSSPSPSPSSSPPHPRPIPVLIPSHPPIPGLIPSILIPTRLLLLLVIINNLSRHHSSDITPGTYRLTIPLPLPRREQRRTSLPNTAVVQSLPLSLPPSNLSADQLATSKILPPVDDRLLLAPLLNLARAPLGSESIV
ncbi:hypothetical protein TCAP_02811 [Tolypocladium capitatum]|uniref:Uncharacterized protein n=1 Tax=Tolypocladium capitatum TaxID=45235 RepID=A0A2K3QIA4_9HYPO|nr:hypothetical protein TCAP_02811 [Tolypocladium capitatum]